MATTFTQFLSLHPGARPLLTSAGFSLAIVVVNAAAANAGARLDPSTMVGQIVALSVTVLLLSYLRSSLLERDALQRSLTAQAGQTGVPLVLWTQ